jgi:hypothetical protein
MIRDKYGSRFPCPVKGKVVPVRHESVYGSGCIDPHFLDLGTSWRWVVSFTPLSLYTRRKNPRYPLNWRLDGPKSRSGQRLPELAFRHLGRPARSQSLYRRYRLRYPAPLLWPIQSVTLAEVYFSVYLTTPSSNGRVVQIWLIIKA